MFDFLFGGKRKVELIRELLEQRMRESGFDGIDSRIEIKKLGNVQLLGTPEGLIVTIIETVISLQKKGLLLWQIIENIESHRKRIGENFTDYKKIINVAKGSSDEAHTSIPMYCLYRLSIEFPHKMSEMQFYSAFNQAAEAMMKDVN